MSWPPRCSSRGTRGRVAPELPVLDVLATIPRELMPDDVRHLEKVFRLEAGDPLAQLLAWTPEDEGDKAIKAYLLRFAGQVIGHYEAARRSLSTTRRTSR